MGKPIIFDLTLSRPHAICNCACPLSGVTYESAESMMEYDENNKCRGQAKVGQKVT